MNPSLSLPLSETMHFEGNPKSHRNESNANRNRHTTAYYQFSKLVVTSTPTDICTGARSFISGQISCLRSYGIISYFSCALKSRCVWMRSIFPLKVTLCVWQWPLCRHRCCCRRRRRHPHPSVARFSQMDSNRCEPTIVPRQMLDGWDRICCLVACDANGLRETNSQPASKLCIRFHFVIRLNDKRAVDLLLFECYMWRRNLLNWKLIYETKRKKTQTKKMMERRKKRSVSFVSLDLPLSRIEEIKITLFSTVNFTMYFHWIFTYTCLCPSNRRLHTCICTSTHRRSGYLIRLSYFSSVRRHAVHMTSPIQDSRVQV